MAVCICSVGSVTSVGLNAEQTFAAVRAGISGYRQSAVMNKRLDPMTLALVPGDALDPLGGTNMAAATPQKKRMLQLAIPALSEAVGSLLDVGDIPLFLAVPEAPPDRPGIDYDDFLDCLMAEAATALCRDDSEIIAGHQAAGMVAVQRAIEYLEAGRGEFVLAGGVDTCIDLHMLATLDREDRVLADGVMDGYAPGEGAGFLLLCSQGATINFAEPRLVQLHMPGLSEEQGHRSSDLPCSGDGLTNAIRQALQGLQDRTVERVLTNLNGENEGAKEWGIALSRHSKVLDPDMDLIHPAENFGDIGTASALVLLGLGAILLLGEQNSEIVLVGCSSETASRGAACLTLPQ